MTLRVTDIIGHTEDAEFGACELCYSTGYIYWNDLEIKDHNGNTMTYDGYGEWDWGDYYDRTNIDQSDLFNFTSFLNHTTKDLTVSDVDDSDFEHMINVFNEINDIIDDLSLEIKEPVNQRDDDPRNRLLSYIVDNMNSISVEHIKQEYEFEDLGAKHPDEAHYVEYYEQARENAFENLGYIHKLCESSDWIKDRKYIYQYSDEPTI